MKNCVNKIYSEIKSDGQDKVNDNKIIKFI